MRIGLLGDTHGNRAWVLYALDKFRREGITTIIQVGDLGVWPGERSGKSWNKVNETLLINEQTMYVAPGNHEDYDRIESLRRNKGGWLVFRERILLAPRGHRNTFEGVDFVWLGGAASVDRFFRQDDWPKSWWEQEAITDKDVARTAEGGHAPVMVCHDAPSGVSQIQARIADNPHGFKMWDIEYAEEVRERLTTAFEAVRPELLLHGHYHFPVDEQVQRDGFSSRIFGLAADGMNFALGHLDLPSLNVVAWDIGEEARLYRNYFQ